jgi:hypothetical protein
MQFGLFMMPLHPPERSFTESYDRGPVDRRGPAGVCGPYPSAL